MTDTAAWSMVTQGVLQSPLHFLDGFSLTCNQSHQAKNQTKTTQPEYLSHTEKDI